MFRFARPCFLYMPCISMPCIVLALALALAACADFPGASDTDNHPDRADGGPAMSGQPRTVLPDSLVARLAPQQRGVRGRWRRGRQVLPAPESRIEELESIGYVAGSVAAREEAGVVRHDAARAFAGHNFYSSGHEPGAALMDMDGEVRHRWRYAYADAFPDHLPEKRTLSTEFWRRAHLLRDGSVIAIFEGQGILRVDRDSNLVWAVHNNAHHDLAVTPDGELLVLTRTAHVVEHVSPKHPVLEDYLCVLDPRTGEERRRISLLEAFERGEPDHHWPEAYQVFWAKERTRNLSDSDPADLFHTNSVEWLDGSLADRAPEFRRGRVLLSMRNLDTIAVLDLESETVVWSLAGTFNLQHEPTVARDGSILVFDNHWVPNTWSRIATVDPASGATSTHYAGSMQVPFHSHSCGTVASLPNGNILVTESDNGRAFEITPDRDIVWEFANPFRAGDSDEYVATLFEVVRLPPEFPVGWAES
ncbi:MAG: hypothetical protein HKN12_07190 [Gemmatimonadetes bacterium]|nr:hypothetical protein [Gemmatimonadota bacterium]